MRSWKAWVAAGLAAAFLGLLGFGLTRDARELPSALIGREAPGFRAPTLSGDTLSLEALRGDVVLLNFWASWCGPCRVEHPVLLRAERAWGDRVHVVGVVYQDSRAAARRFMEQLGGDWPSVVDPGSRIAIDYGVYGPPETFFVSPDGVVARKQIGPVTWPLVRSTVDSLLAAGAASAAAGGPPAANRPPPSAPAVAGSGTRDAAAR